MILKRIEDLTEMQQCGSIISQFANIKTMIKGFIKALAILSQKRNIAV